MALAACGPTAATRRFKLHAQSHLARQVSQKKGFAGISHGGSFFSRILAEGGRWFASPALRRAIKAARRRRHTAVSAVVWDILGYVVPRATPLTDARRTRRRWPPRRVIHLAFAITTSRGEWWMFYRLFCYDVSPRTQLRSPPRHERAGVGNARKRQLGRTRHEDLVARLLPQDLQSRRAPRGKQRLHKLKRGAVTAA
jgi:hypothetical protein